jgi:hypothetical protein
VLAAHQIEYFNKKHPPRIAQPIDRQANVFLQDAATEGPDGAAGWGEFDAGRVMAGIRQRLELPFHQVLHSIASTYTALCTVAVSVQLQCSG